MLRAALLPRPTAPHRRRRGRVLLALAALIALAPGPLKQQPNVEEMLDELDRAFAAPQETLKPALLIFPVIGADDRVRADGAGLGHMASLAMVYTTRKLSPLSVPLAQEVLRDAGCTKTGATLDKETIQLCLAALGTKLYAIPKLVSRDDTDLLTISCHGDGDKYRDRTFTHTIKPRDLRRVPGLIAHDVQEYLGVQLRPEEREMVAAPQVRDEQDLLTLMALASGHVELGEKDSTIRDLLSCNPRCVFGWELYLNRATDRAGAVRSFDKPQPAADCPGLRMAYAALVGERGEPERALRIFLPLLASHRTDASFWAALFQCATRLKEQRVAYRVLELWRKADATSYAACLARGEGLIEWAWQASAALHLEQDAAEKFQERLGEARRELDEALKTNPSGWAAHAAFIRVVNGLKLPHEFMEGHFQRAIKLRPRYAQAYAAKLEYLMPRWPRWQGTAEEVLAFGQQCLATGFWDEHVPQLFPLALRESCLDARERATDSQLLKLPAVWDSVLAYYHGAQKNAGRVDRTHALNWLIDWGIRSGHYEDVVVPLQKLRDPGRIDRTVFPDDDELDFLYDLVHVKTGKLRTQLRSPRKHDLALAKTSLALAAGDLDEAARLLEQVKPADPLEGAKAATYRAALAAGRKLAQDKFIRLQGAEGLEMFLGARPLWKFGGSQFVCSVPAGSRASLTCPLGIKHGVITGILEWSGGVSQVQVVLHTRALRDKLILRYQPERGIVEAIRNDSVLQGARLQPGSVPLHLDYGARMDTAILVPIPAAFPWAPAVDNDVPSGFSFQISTTDRPATFTVRDLLIQLKD